MTCNNPVEVFLGAAGVFFPAKMTFLGFFGHVIALLRSSYVPQALLFSSKMTFLGLLGHVMALLKSSYVPQALFFRQAVAHKSLFWLYFDGRGLIKAHSLRELAFINGSGFG